MSEPILRSRGSKNHSAILIEEHGAKFPPRKVFIKTIITKMGEIDTAKECFTAEVVIQAKWREESLDSITEDSVKGIDYEKLWNPKLYVSNLVSEIKDSTSYTVIFPDDDDGAFVLLQKKLKGVFLENLELQDFPFDIQDITVSITSELTNSEVKLIGDEESLVNVNSFVDEQEWKLRSGVRLEKGESEDIVFGGRSVGRKHPFLNFKCTAERRYQYFIWNFIVILVFICLMSFTIFAVDYKYVQNRLQLTFILLLTTIAFKSNVNNFLPKISYLTYMDIYFLGSWVIQCLMCAWHAIVGSLLLDEPNVFWIDKGLLIAFFIIFVIFQVSFVSFALIKLKQKKKSFDKAPFGSFVKLSKLSPEENVRLSNHPKATYQSMGGTSANTSSN